LHAFGILQGIENLVSGLVLACQKDVMSSALLRIGEDGVCHHYLTKLVLVASLPVVGMVALGQDVKDAANGIRVSKAADLQYLVVI
jgi:hypothetical protein